MKDIVENEIENDDEEKDESNGRKCSEHMESEVGDSDGCIAKWCIVLLEIELQSCDVKEEGQLEY